MTISVITPTLNMAVSIRKTVESVVRQTHPVQEYIVVDGYSTDATVSVVHEYSKNLPIRVVEQKPAGVYAAMNTGIRMAVGDIVCILNGDDYFFNANVLAQVEEAFMQNPHASILYGDIVYKDFASGAVVRKWRAGSFSLKKIYNGWAMPHPAVFVRRALYAELGLFNETFRIAGDYEIMVRWLVTAGVEPVYLPETLVVMAPGGASGRSLRARMQGWKELRRAWVVNNMRPPFAFTARRILGKVGQYLI